MENSLNKWKDPITEAAWRNILDTFTGADGGVRFARLTFLLKHLDQTSSEDNPVTKDIMLIIRKMSKLIDVAQKAMGG